MARGSKPIAISGFARLWFADDAGADAAFRRYVARAGETDEAVDIEALRQQIEPVDHDSLVERVQLIWPLRNREKLLEVFRSEPTIVAEGRGKLDPDDAESPEVDQFVLLDRPPVAATSGLKAAEIPRVAARVFVGTQIVGLEAYDDERLGSLSDRFTALTGSAIAPAQPRTKVLGHVPRSSLPLVIDWLPPEGLSQTDLERVTREEHSRILREVWPNTPQSYLGGRSPLQAAKAGNARVPLRAAFLRMELTSLSTDDSKEHAALRALLSLRPSRSPIPTRSISSVCISLACTWYPPIGSTTTSFSRSTAGPDEWCCSWRRSGLRGPWSTALHCSRAR